MKTKLTLGVLDQSPIRNNGTFSDALQESVQLAKTVEKLGFNKYWVAEHHNSSLMACTSPEILVCQIAANTQSMQIGSGGVMLLNYSPLKIVEQFRILETLYPGRINLGLGKARGTDEFGAKALAYPNPIIADTIFQDQLDHLLMFFSNNFPNNHPFSGIDSQTGVVTAIPEIWILGTGYQTAQLAGKMGLKFAIADFLCFGEAMKNSPTDEYMKCFRPSQYASEPEICVALDVICSETKEEAYYIASSRKLMKAAKHYGYKGLLDPKEAIVFPLDESVKAALDHYNTSCIDGDVDYVLERIIEKIRFYKANQVMILTNCYLISDRVKSYELIARNSQKLADSYSSLQMA